MSSVYFYCYFHHRNLHSFPTRRSSDLNLLAPVLAVNKVVNHSALDRAGAVESVQGGQVLDGIGRVAPQHVAHAVRFKLEHRSEEHTSELQSHVNLVCRLLLEKKNAHPT